MVCERSLVASSGTGDTPIRTEIYVHPHRDPGCLLNGHEYLRSMSLRFGHALVMFDHMGCGPEQDPPDSIERRVNADLEISGWADRAKAIVLVPVVLPIWPFLKFDSSLEIENCGNRDIQATVTFVRLSNTSGPHANRCRGHS